jgi:hypothetical protein
MMLNLYVLETYPTHVDREAMAIAMSAEVGWERVGEELGFRLGTAAVGVGVGAGVALHVGEGPVEAWEMSVARPEGAGAATRGREPIPEPPPIRMTRAAANATATHLGRTRLGRPRLESPARPIRTITALSTFAVFRGRPASPPQV